MARYKCFHCDLLFIELDVLRHAFSRCCGKLTTRTSSLLTRSVLYAVKSFSKLRYALVNSKNSLNKKWWPSAIFITAEIILHQGIDFHGPNIVLNSYVDCFL